MDDGEIDFSDHPVFSDCNDPSMENFLDELLKNTHSCTHTHTCNPPGPDNTHTHTCFHTHTQLFAPLDGKVTSDQTPNLTSEQVLSLDSPCEPSSKKQTLGNREAVRKYREKKKAQTAYLEEQVLELRSINQQLVRKLQGQAALESEVVRLRSLLAEFRGRIDGEIGPCPPAQKLHLDPTRQDIHKKDGALQPLPGGYYLNSCNLPCDADVRCFHSPVSSEKGPSTPQEHNSFAGGSGLSCETLNGGCRVRTKKAKTKE